MTCTDINALYSGYYDGVLETEELAAFEAHLSECPACIEDYEAYKALLDEIHALPEPLLTDDFHETVTRSLRETILADVSPGTARTTRTTRPKRKIAGLKPYLWAVSGTAACFVLLSILVSGISGLIGVTGNRRSGGLMGQVEQGYYMRTAETATYMDMGETVALESVSDTQAALSVSTSADAGEIVMESSLAGREAFIEAANNDTSGMLAAGYFEQTFNIDITVEDLEAAAQVISQMNGYNINANAHYSEYGGSAYYQRRVDVAAYTQVKEALRALGQVTNEYESVVKLADDVYDLEARLRAKEEESVRLIDLLSQSRTMAVLAAVERRLGSVETERDELRGRLREIYNTTARPFININLNETPHGPVIMPEETFLERLREQFIRSVNAFVVFMEDSVVFFSGAFIPLLIIVAFAGLIITFIRRHGIKRAEKIAIDSDSREERP